jgi:hypothetical protein
MKPPWMDEWVGYSKGEFPSKDQRSCIQDLWHLRALKGGAPSQAKPQRVGRRGGDHGRLKVKQV